MTSPLVEIASRIGARLAASALHRDNRCTWRIPAIGPRDKAGAMETAGPNVYRGSAGIGMFLSELYSVTGDAVVARTARAAVRHALDGVERSSQPGFHNGVVGVAYVAECVGARTADQELQVAARALVKRILQLGASDRRFDVIGGAAGAIPALLVLRDRGDFDVAYDLALSLGEQLFENTKRAPEGWSWSTMPVAVRNVTGFAHGTSGIGVALLELALATGDARFRYAAHQAFAYERHHFDSGKQNWMDYRHRELSDLIQRERGGEITRRVRAGERFDWSGDRTAMAWCHGAPGAGLARLRAYQLEAVPEWLEEARTAVAITKGSLLNTEPYNYSLCHGIAGNSETLLHASALLGEPTWKAYIIDRLAEAASRYERDNAWWPSGAPGAPQDATLMFGDAGIGHFFLRLADVGIPSVLLLAPQPANIDVTCLRDAEVELSFRRQDIEYHFGNTLSAMDRFFVDEAWSQSLALTVAQPLPVMRVANAISTRIAAEPPTNRREMLEDAFAVERTKAVLLSSELNLTTSLLDAYVREPEDVVDWDADVMWRLADNVRVVPTRWNWSTLAPHEQPESRDDDGSGVLLIRHGYAVEEQPLGSLSLAVFELLQQAITVSAIVQRVAADAGVPPHEVRLRHAIVEQMKAGYAAGVVVRRWP